MVTLVQRSFWTPFGGRPVRRSQPRGIQSVGVSPATLLSFAIAVVTRRRPWYARYP